MKRRYLPLIIGAAVLAAVLIVGFFVYRRLPGPPPAVERYEKPSDDLDVIDEPLQSPAAGEASQRAVDFTVYDAEGNEVRLSDHFGTPLVVNFWTSWCPPCAGELPDFQEMYDLYGDRAEFLMVNLTTSEDAGRQDTDAFIARNGYTFPLYYDDNGNAAQAYSIYSIPQTVFITAEGNISASYLGAIDRATLERELEAIMPQQTSLS